MITSVIVPKGHGDKERKRRWKGIVMKKKPRKKNEMREDHTQEKS
jgi:hypothetical protein